jgi:outer membrane receptor protein involved in Fe transport
LLLSSAALSAALAGPVLAQAPVGGVDETLGEVVVTATRQADTVNRVPLSITAVTQKSLDQQGIRNAQDLAASVPALRITANTTNGAQVSIRGIASSAGGVAATTGVYLDDVPLQRRSGQGAVNGIGVIFPQLFDLERVEVLRGPQGTLYGGSSMGGTVRFITPAPSTTRYSGQARLELSTIEQGSQSYDVGLALGGPIVQDKLGFRASGTWRHLGGWIDHVSRFTGNTLAKDTNSDEAYAVRLALLWQVTDRLSVTPSIYRSRERKNDVDAFWENVPAFTQAERYYTSAGAATTATSPTRAFTYPAHTYGPYDMFGPYKSGSNMCVYADALVTPANDQCAALQPRTDLLTLPSVTVDYAFEHMSMKAITSMVIDKNQGYQPMFSQSLGTANAGNEFVFNLPYVDHRYFYATKRYGVTEELRFASNNAESPLSWVGGVYFSNFRTTSYALDLENADLYNVVLKGVPLAAANKFPGRPDLYSYRNQYLKETEVAAFGEANYLITSKLKATAGLRVSRNSFAYVQESGGPALGFLAGTLLNGGYANGSIAESPVTAKVGLSYQFDAASLAYVSAAKGYRPGGVNATAPGSNGNTGGRCFGDLSSLGLTTTPQTYGSDSVWSYEAGAKLRTLGGKAQINASVFRIDWNSPQTNFGLPTCGFSFIINAGKARSQGFDLQANARLLPGLTVTAAVAYTDAKQLQDVVGPAPRFTRFVTTGDLLAGAPWSVSLGAQYDFSLGGLATYVRGDFRYSSAYRSGGQFPDSSYRPELLNTLENDVANLRAGVTVRNVELSVFVNNVYNSQDRFGSGVSGSHSGCTTATCTAPGEFTSFFPVTRATTFQPRTWGVTAAYRY